MDQFVCVRLVKANALDLTLFQFDFDLTFAVFFLNADRTLYGRYGTRSDHHEAERDISLAGFREALSGALALHRGYPDNRRFLVGKQSQPGQYRTPDDFPLLKGKYQESLDYKGQVAKSCLHCHQIREAEREVYREARQPIPDPVLYPWPMPATIGLTLDPDTRATVKKVEAGSAAERAGIQEGDVLLTLDGQALLSMADVQWALHRAPDSGRLPVVLRRNDATLQLELPLAAGWRRADISWRVTTWSLRRMATGGLKVSELDEQKRADLGLGPDDLALHVDHVGQYGPHAAAKRAGFLQGDVIVDVADLQGPLTETQLLAFVLQTQPQARQIQVTVLRGGKRVNLQMPTQ